MWSFLDVNKQSPTYWRSGTIIVGDDNRVKTHQQHFFHGNKKLVHNLVYLLVMGSMPSHFLVFWETFAHSWHRNEIVHLVYVTKCLAYFQTYYVTVTSICLGPLGLQSPVQRKKVFSPKSTKSRCLTWEENF